MGKKVYLFFCLIPLFFSCQQVIPGGKLLSELNNAIDWVNSDAFEILIQVQEGTGELGVSEKITVRVQEPFSVIFKINEGYNFDRWCAVKKSNPSEVLEDYVSFDNPGLLETKATILKYDTDMVIVPSCIEKEYAMVTFASEGGFIVPVGRKKIHIDEEIQIQCDVSDIYDFQNYWEIFETATNKPVQNAVYITTVDGITTAKLLKTDKNITINAHCKLRPISLLTTPDYSRTNNKYRDEKIRVVFDQPMDINSIYYTSEELSKLPTGSTFLESESERDSQGNFRIYGYEYNNEIIWKNISIVNLSNNNQNLLKHYKNPHFSSKQVLVIPTNLADLPPLTSDIHINLSNNFCNEEQVCLTAPITWNYYLAKNAQKDTTPPVFNSVELWSQLENGVLEAETMCSDETKYPSIAKVKSNLKDPNISCLYLKNRKLKIKASLSDDVSGIYELILSIIPVCNANEVYNNQVQEQRTKKITVPITFESENHTALSDCILDLTEYLNSTDSYKLQFSVKDESGNTADYSKAYYISGDYAPTISNLIIKTVQKSGEASVNIQDCAAILNPSLYKSHEEYISSNRYSTFPYSKTGEVTITANIEFPGAIKSLTYIGKRVLNEKQEDVSESDIIFYTDNYTNVTEVPINKTLNFSTKPNGVYNIILKLVAKDNTNYLFHVGDVLIDSYVPSVNDVSGWSANVLRSSFDADGTFKSGYISVSFNFTDFIGRYDLEKVLIENITIQNEPQKTPSIQVQKNKMNINLPINPMNLKDNSCKYHFFFEDCWGNVCEDYKEVLIVVKEFDQSLAAYM